MAPPDSCGEQVSKRTRRGDKDDAAQRQHVDEATGGEARRSSREPAFSTENLRLALAEALAPGAEAGPLSAVATAEEGMEDRPGTPHGVFGLGDAVLRGLRLSGPGSAAADATAGESWRSAPPAQCAWWHQVYIRCCAV